MNWPTLLCVSTASICVALGAMHLSIWARNRQARANLAFAVLALGVALFTWCCLLMLRAQSPLEFAKALWWTNATVLIMAAALVAFVRLYFRQTRMWLGHLAVILRAIAMTAHTWRWPASDFDVITRLQSVDFLGEPVSVAVGIPSIWFGVGQLSLTVLFAFIVDAAWSSWRTGEPTQRRRVLAIGVPAALFVGGGTISAALIFTGVVAWPHLEFVAFLVVLAMMGYELTGDVVRAARLAGDLRVSEAALRESEQQMTMAADAARLGLWMWNLRTGDIWLTRQCRRMHGLPSDAVVKYSTLAEQLHDEERDRLDAAVRRAVDTGAPQQVEYNVDLPDHAAHWIDAHVAVDLDDDSRPFRIRGVCIDVSERRQAERAARELSGRLINAQEDERKRLARELHDDFNQRLALLSIELQLLGRGQSEHAVTGLAHVADQIRHLSTEVHKLSYRLHPAKLDQLGLEKATRSLCRDISKQSAIPVDFIADGVPPDVAPESSLCLYRIAQEALRNVIRHSGASAASIELMGDYDTLRMVVADNGRGFDASTASSSPGLGLLSMRERVHLSRGTMTVESKPGGGTRILVTVPIGDRVATVVASSSRSA